MRRKGSEADRQRRQEAATLAVHYRGLARELESEGRGHEAETARGLAAFAAVQALGVRVINGGKSRYRYVHEV